MSNQTTLTTLAKTTIPQLRNILGIQGGGTGDTLFKKDVGSSDIKAITASDNIDLQDGGLKDTNVTTAIKLGDENNIELNTINQTLIGGINETQNKLNNIRLGGGGSLTYYLSSDSSGVSTYKTLTNGPKISNSVSLEATVNNNRLLIESYITQELNTTKIDSGEWSFNLYGSVDSQHRVSNFDIEICKYNIDSITGLEVIELLFTLSTENINTITPNIQIATAQTIQPEFSVQITDKLFIKIYAKTTANQDVVITLYNDGNNYNSHIHTPYKPSLNNNLFETINEDIQTKDNDYNLNLKSKGLKDTNVTTAIKLGDENNIELNTSNKTLVGGINEIQNKVNNIKLGGGSAITYYLSSLVSDIALYKTLTNTPNLNPTVIKNVIVNNNQVLIDHYITQPLNVSKIDAGEWSFNLYGSVDKQHIVSNFIIEVYKYGVNNVATLLFTLQTQNINAVSPKTEIVSSQPTQGEFAMELTDRLYIKIYAKTTSTQDITMMLYNNGTQYNSHIYIPYSGSLSVNRQIWGYQDFEPGVINSTSVTLTLNENGTSAPFDTSNIINSSAGIFRKNGESFAYSSSISLFSTKIVITAQTGTSITLNAIPHASWGTLRIWYQIKYTSIPEDYTNPPLTVQNGVVVELGKLFEESENKTDSWQGVSTTLYTSQKALYDSLNSLSAYEAVYVDPARGNNTTGNGTSPKPFQTIQSAINSFTAGSPRVIYVNGSTTGNIVFRNGDQSMMIVFDPKTQHSGNITFVAGNTSIYFLCPNGKATFSGTINDASLGNIYYDVVFTGIYNKTGGSNNAIPSGYIEFSPNSNIDGMRLNLSGNTIFRTLGTGSMGQLTQSNGIFSGQHKGTILCPTISGGANPLLGQPLCLLDGQIQLIANANNKALLCSASYGVVYIVGISTLQYNRTTYGQLDFTGCGVNCFCYVWSHSQLANSGDVFPPSGAKLVNFADYLSANYTPTNYQASNSSVKSHLQGIDAKLFAITDRDPIKKMVGGTQGTTLILTHGGRLYTITMSGNVSPGSGRSDSFDYQNQSQALFGTAQPVIFTDNSVIVNPNGNGVTGFTVGSLYSEVGKAIDVGILAGVAIVLFDSGNLWGWGYNSYGALGLGNTTTYTIPKLIATEVSKIFTHSSNSCDQSATANIRVVFQKTNGKVYGAGRNDQGELGLGNNTSIISSFTELTWIGINPINVWNLGAYLGHIIAEVDTGTTTNGIKLTKIMTCGWNNYGQLGTGNTTQYNTAVDITTSWTGSATTTKRIMSIGHNGTHFTTEPSPAVADNTETILMWLRETNNSGSTPDQIKTAGRNIRGLLGINNTNALYDALTVQTVSINASVNLSIKQFSLLAGNIGVAAVLLNDNTLWTWGTNDIGQVGVNASIGVNALVPLPTQVKYQNGMGVSNLMVSEIIYGDSYGGLMLRDTAWKYSSIFVKGTDGHYYATGYNATGLLGNGTVINTNVFQRMGFPPNTTFNTFSFIADGTRLILNPIWVDLNGDLWIWGENDKLFGDTFLVNGGNRSLTIPYRFEWKLPKS